LGSCTGKPLARLRRKPGDAGNQCRLMILRLSQTRRRKSHLVYEYDSKPVLAQGRNAGMSAMTENVGVYSPGGVLLSPFWAWAAHVVQLGPIRVEQRAPQPAPPQSDYVKVAASPRGRKQHSRHVRFCKRGHYKPPFSVRLSHGGPSGTKTPLQAQLRLRQAQEPWLCSWSASQGA